MDLGLLGEAIAVLHQILKARSLVTQRCLFST